MSEQFTPGPWRVNPQTPSTVITPDGMISISWRSTDGVADSKAEAAARLVAASRDLYDACIGLLEGINDIWYGQGSPSKSIAEIVADADAALAKVRGEQ